VDTVILFSFPSISKFHRVGPLLQACSTNEFLYDHVCFCVYVYLLYLSPTYERKHAAFIWLTSDNIYVLHLHLFTFQPHVITLCG
jgi:hypothetical protein